MLRSTLSMPSRSMRSMPSMISMRAMSSTAYIALGSNLGNRASALHEALGQISKISSVLATSFLYESEPMYHSKQPAFLNAACKINTSLAPKDLLASLKEIEAHMGRQESFRNGPRLIDLDIILYEKQLVTCPELAIPHPRMTERAFVLRPMCDLDPELVHPIEQKTMSTLYNALDASAKKELNRVIPCYNHKEKKTRYLRLDSGLPIIMGVVNVTPDSFSDGGMYSLSIQDAVQHAIQLAADGAEIIDIGGESTRPGASAILTYEQITRIVPTIRLLREEGHKFLISVDTRRAEVAQAAIDAGADIINDVSGGAYDQDMLPLMKRLQVPYIAMHMRGEPSTMQDAQHSSYVDPLVEVEAELQQRLAQLDLVLPRWLQLVDPGIGFAKGYAENMQLLHPPNLLRFKQALGNRPLLVGLSRKRFLSKIHEQVTVQRRTLVSGFDEDSQCQREGGVERYERMVQKERRSLEERDMLTAGANCAAVLGGADILRVHNARETRLVADAFLSIASRR